MVSLHKVEPEELEKTLLEDANRKLSIAYNVVQACKEEIQSGKSVPHFRINDRVTNYTKAEFYVILRSKGLIRPKIKYTESKEIDEIPQFNPSLYEHLRKIYVDWYLTKNLFPTNIAFEVISKKRKDSLKLRRILKDNGFTYIKVPGTLKGFVIEKPSQVRAKCEYFSKIAQYRNEGRDVVYIDERECNKVAILKTFHKLDNNTRNMYFIAGNKDGPIHLHFCTMITVDSSLRHFLLDLVMKVKRPTVFVIGETFYHEKNKCPLPKPDSSKVEMSQFLTRNNIPHDKDAPKAELHLLIQKCKSTCKTEFYTLDDLVSSYGHVILRRPIVLTSLNFFNEFSKRLKDHVVRQHKQERKNVTSMLKLDMMTVLQTMSLEDWQKADKNVIEMENQMYTEDVQIEEIVDKFLTMAKDGNVPQPDLWLKNMMEYTETGCNAVQKIVM